MTKETAKKILAVLPKVRRVFREHDGYIINTTEEYGGFLPSPREELAELKGENFDFYLSKDCFGSLYFAITADGENLAISCLPRERYDYGVDIKTGFINRAYYNTFTPKYVLRDISLFKKELVKIIAE